MKFREYVEINNIDKNIRKLDLSHKGFTDLYGIEEFKNLAYLEVQNNSIEDMSVLKDMVNIRFLYIHTNPINNYDIFNKMINLRDLIVFDKFDLKYISNCALLERIGLYYTSVGELCGIEDFKHLKKLLFKAPNTNGVSTEINIDELKKELIPYNRKKKIKSLLNEYCKKI